jgi:hypothetical protein
MGYAGKKQIEACREVDSRQSENGEGGKKAKSGQRYLIFLFYFGKAL